MRASAMTNYYDNPFKRENQKINALFKNFGPYVNCIKCGAFLKIDSEGKSGERQITVKVECSKCGFKEYGLKIDY